MVKKKIKRRLPIQNGSETNLPQESIKKYFPEKNIIKYKKHSKIRNKHKQNSIPLYSTQNNKYKRKKSLPNGENNMTVEYEIKPLSPTKTKIICVKKFYNNNNYKQYENNLYDRKKSADTKPAKKNTEHDKICRRTNNKLQCVKNHKPRALIPQLNKEKSKKKRKFNDTEKSAEVLHKKYNLENNKIQLNSSEKIVSNETRTNEYITEEYQVTQSLNNAPSISVKSFYKSQIPSKINDNEKVNKDMPLISDTTFNSNFNQSPSKLSVSHKISLNVKHISDTTNNKQQKVTAFFPIRRSARKTKNIVNEEKQLALENAITSQNEDWLKIAVFPNKGRGIIADKDFTRGEYVVEYAGELICLQEARKREAIYSQDITTGCYMYYFKYGLIHYCIDATAESSRLGRLVNHSRFGNLGPKVVELSGLPRIVLVAKIDIKQGEELTYDYGDRSKQSLVNHPWLAS